MYLRVYSIYRSRCGRLIPATLRCRSIDEETTEMLMYMLIYQFGEESSRTLDLIDLEKIKICFSRRTKRIRAFLYRDKILSMVRASDFYIVPHIELGILLHKVLPFPKRRVVVAKEMVDDIVKGNSVFAKHIVKADESIRPYDEVLVVDEDDKLISVGRALLDYETMITATYGVAVQIREKIGEQK
ncbi:MAG: PUA domain-containing protein [Ignisphaera sp.]|uniref:PUA domain-containing protein n=1 Tax=Ignisphaera aggregans TaxID=334771 RepID=A0A7J3N003_9CREN